MDLKELFENFEKYQKNEISFTQMRAAINLAYGNGALKETDESGDTFLHKLVRGAKPSPEIVSYLLTCNPRLADLESDNYPYDSPAVIISERLDEEQIPEHEVAWRSTARLIANRTKDDSIKAELMKKLSIHVGKLSADSTSFEHVPEVPKLNTPTVFCFSGQGCTEPRKAERFAHLVMDSVTLINDENCAHKLQCYSVWYPGNIEDVQKDRDFYKNGDGAEPYDSPYQYLEPFVANYFRPLYQHDGQKIEVEAACKNLRNINFVSYSYGAAVVQMVSEIMKTDMEKYGYEDEEIRHMQQQVFSLTLGGDVDYNKDLNNFTSVHMVNAQDKVVPLALANKIAEKHGYSADNFRITHLQNRRNKTYVLAKSLHLTDFVRNDGMSAARMDIDTHNPEVYFFDSVHSENRLFNAMRSAALVNALNSSCQSASLGQLCQLPEKMLKQPTSFKYIEQIEDKQQMSLKMYKMCQNLDYDDKLAQAYIHPKTDVMMTVLAAKNQRC